MKRLRLSLGVKLFVASALIVLVTGASIGVISFIEARQAIEQEASRHLLGVATERCARLELWFSERMRAASMESAPEIRLVIESCEIHRAECPGILPPLTSFLEHKLALDSTLLFASVFDQELNLLACAGSGIGDHAPVNLPEVVSARGGKGAFGKLTLNDDNIPALNLAVPFPLNDGTSGILLQQFSSANTINPVLADISDLGEQGEAYLVDSDTIMITPSRFEHHPMPLTHKMPLPPVLEALQGKTGVMIYPGFVGGEVMGAYDWIPQTNWALIVEMDVREVFAPLRKILVDTMLAATVALAIMLSIVLLLARNWSRPLGALVSASHRVGKGDFSIRIPDENRSDEIGSLVTDFNRMVQGLEDSRRQLVQSEKLAAIGQLVAGVVHEMRNPLSSIKMNVQLLQRRLQEESSIRESLEIASGEVERLEKMLTELLDYSKPSSFKTVDFTAAELVERVRRVISEPAAASDVELLFTVAPEVHSLHGDLELIEQAVVNLLQNSIQACEKKGSVQLLISTQDGSTVLEITDNGRGMSSHVLDRLYDPFFTTRPDGVGLGMATVRKIVEGHNGILELESEVDRGTTARIVIPGGSS
jgi:signal transduction histidine kinase